MDMLRGCDQQVYKKDGIQYLIDIYDKVNDPKHSVEFESKEVLETLHDDAIKIVIGAITVYGPKSIDYLKLLFQKHEKEFGSKFNLNITESMWTCPLSYALYLREEEVALYLIEYGADVNYIDHCGLSPINYAVSTYDYSSQVRLGKIITTRKNKEIPKAIISLIVNGANVAFCNPRTKNYPCYEAMENNYLFSSKQIQIRIDTIKKNKKPDELELIKDFLENENHNIDIFFDSLAKGDEEKSLELLENDKSLARVLDSFGQNALHYAVRCGMRRVIKKLILAGVDYKRQSRGKLTPHDIAKQFPKKIYDMSKYLDNCIDEKNKKYSTKMKDDETSTEKNNSKYSIDSNSSDHGSTDSEESTDFHPKNENKIPKKVGQFVILNENNVKSKEADEIAKMLIIEDEENRKKILLERKKIEENKQKEKDRKAKKEKAKLEIAKKKKEEQEQEEKLKIEERERYRQDSIKKEKDKLIRFSFTRLDFYYKKIKILYLKQFYDKLIYIGSKKKKLIAKQSVESKSKKKLTKNVFSIAKSKNTNENSVENEEHSKNIPDPIEDSSKLYSTNSNLKLEHLKYHLFLFFQNEKEKNDLVDDTDFSNFLFKSEKDIKFWKNNKSNDLDNYLVDSLIKYINLNRNYQST